MTNSANSSRKPSPSDTPTHRPEDRGGKSKLKSEDREYHANKPHGGRIAEKHEREEQPVHPGDKDSLKL